MEASVSSREQSPSVIRKSKDASGNGQRKRRAVARARRPRGEFDSDDEIERNVGSDSDSQASTSSVSDSASDGSDLDDTASTSPRITAAKSLSPKGSELALEPRSSSRQSLHNSPPTSTATDGKGKAPLLAAIEPVNWSDVVQEELANGTDEIPVIDFADFTSGSPGQTSASPHTQDTRKRQSATGEAASPVAKDEQDTEATAPSNQAPPLTSPHQSARQAYQRRLSEDPSYVPVVGEFWGHDDRLMDKGLRSLSGWWRGRWQGRARGMSNRGIVFRGRGAFSRISPQNSIPEKDTSKQPADAPAVDQMWSHDGFEELTHKEDENRRPSGARNSRRGRAAGVDRSRGISPAVSKAYDTSSAVGSSVAESTNPIAHAQVQAAAQGRPWFSRKPERTWTKQFDGFLFVDADLKARGGRGGAIRIRLRAGPAHLIRLPLYSNSEQSTEQVSTVSKSHKDKDKEYVVRLPQTSDTKRRPNLLVHSSETSLPESVTTVDALSLSLPVSSSGVSGPVITTEPTTGSDVVDYTQSTQTAPAPGSNNLEMLDPDLQQFPSVAPLASGAFPQSQLAVPHATHSSYAQPISYSSPYLFNSGLPPGVVYNENGIPIEAMSGRPVFLPPQLPAVSSPYGVPPQMQPLRPANHDMNPYRQLPPEYYMPGPGYVDSQFLQFSLPRQTSRLEIRAPKEQNDTPEENARSQSNFRTNVKAQPFQPASPYATQNGMGDTSEVTGAGHAAQMEMLHNPMLYSGVQYYPAPTYSYNQYGEPVQSYQAYGESGQPLYY